MSQNPIGGSFRSSLSCSIHRFTNREHIQKTGSWWTLSKAVEERKKKYSVRFYELRYFHELRSFMSSEQTALCSSNIVIINNQSGAISKDQPNPSCCLFGKLINWASDAGLLSLLLKFHSVVFMLPVANSLHFYAFG